MGIGAPSKWVVLLVVGFCAIGAVGVLSILAHSLTVALAPSCNNPGERIPGTLPRATSPYDFVFSPDDNNLYVADDGIGAQKFRFNGSSSSFANAFQPRSGDQTIALEAGGSDAVGGNGIDTAGCSARAGVAAGKCALRLFTWVGFARGLDARRVASSSFAASNSLRAALAAFFACLKDLRASL